MKKLITLLSGFWFMWMPAQTELIKASMAPSGGAAATGTKEMVYTVAEVFTAEAQTDTRHLSEGFINPDLIALMNAENFAPLPGVEIYPNPVKDILHIRLENKGNYEIYIFDLTGKKIYTRTFDGDRWDVDMRNYRSGFYLVSIVDRENKRMTGIKIQKL